MQEKLAPYAQEPEANNTRGLGRLSVYVGLAVMLTTASLVAVRAGADPAGRVVPHSAGCAVTFNNPGPPALTVCVSNHGNINQLSYSAFGASVSQMGEEGYCLKDLESNATYFDATTQETGWGLANQSSTATTTTVNRNTHDHLFTLTQNIFIKYGSRLVLVGNVLRNNDTVPHTVRFNRYANFNVDGSAAGDIFDVAGASVLAQESNGIALTSLGNPALVQTFGAEAFNEWNDVGRQTCAALFAAGPTAPGDYVAVMQHTTTIAPGATVNFRVGYRLL